MAKLWAGRFEKPTSALLDDFQSSIPFDQRLLECDVTGSIAHATMLGEQGIIPREDAKRIVEGLRGILDDYHAGTLAIDMGAEVVHMFVEALLTDRIGEAGKRLPARSGAAAIAAFAAQHPLQGAPEHRHARLHAPAKGAAHHAGVSPDGLRADVHARCNAL